jgi:uncharacterized SAM-binding protein YcdF (DUF218 family)
MHALKQLVGYLATPLMIALLISVVAVVFRARGRRRIAAALFACAAAVVCLASLVPVGEALLRPLESQYPPLRDDAQLQGVGYIVVLGSSYVPRDHIPVTAALSEDGLFRIVEGLRLARRMPGVRLVVSGGAAPGFTPGAFGYAKLAREFGIADTALVVLDRPLDTGEEARAVKALLGTAPFVLVTSAYHMPRAVRLMLREGTHPIPAPTGQRVGALGGAGLRPSLAGMLDTEIALHEYVGLAALTLGIP